MYLASILLMGSVLGLPSPDGWVGGSADHEAWTREALEIHLHDLDSSRMAQYLGCFVDDELGRNASGPRLALASWKILAVRFHGDSLRYQADLELTADPTHSPAAVGLPTEPVRITLEGEATHEHKLSFMFIVPNLSVENRTQSPRLVSRNGLRLDLDNTVFSVPAPVGAHPALLEAGPPIAVALPQRMALQQAPTEHEPPSELHYGEFQINAQAGEVLHVTVTSRGPRPLRAFLAHVRLAIEPLPLQAQLIAAGTTRDFYFRAPADASLVLRLWTDGYGAPPGDCLIALERVNAAAAREH